MTNNAEEIRKRCKTETNIEMGREGGMAKIDDRVRETERQIRKSTRHGICCRNPVEKGSEQVDRSGS